MEDNKITTIALGSTSYSTERLKIMMASSNKEQAIKLRYGWHALVQGTRFATSGVTEREKKLEELWDKLHSDETTNTPSTKYYTSPDDTTGTNRHLDAIDKLITFNKMRKIATDDKTSCAIQQKFTVKLHQLSSVSYEANYEIDGNTVFTQTVLFVEYNIIKLCTNDRGELEADLTTELIGWRESFKCAFDGCPQQQELEGLLRQLHGEKISDTHILETLQETPDLPSHNDDAIDKLITFNKMRQIVNISGSKPHAFRIKLEANGTNSYTADYKIDGETVFTQTVSLDEYQIIKLCTNDRGELEADLTTELIRKKLDTPSKLQRIFRANLARPRIADPYAEVPAVRNVNRKIVGYKLPRGFVKRPLSEIHRDEVKAGGYKTLRYYGVKAGDRDVNTPQIGLILKNPEQYKKPSDKVSKL